MGGTNNAPCMYCCEAVGADGDSDDGEFFVCGACRAKATRRSRELMGRQAAAYSPFEDTVDPDSPFPFDLRVTRGDLDDYLTHVFGGSRMTPEAFAERILDRIRRDASGELEFDREPTIPLEAAPLPAADCARILAYLHRHGPRFQTFGAEAR